MSHILFFSQLNLRLMNILIPDTSSLINIHEVYVGRVHITNVLDQLFNVQVSREIPHEIRRNRNKLGNYDKPMLQFVRQARRYFPYEQDYEHLIFNQFSPNGDPGKNRGERYNCALALYLVRRRYTGHVIMLTDDMKAHRGLVGTRVASKRQKLGLHWNCCCISISLCFQNGRMLKLSWLYNR